MWVAGYQVCLGTVKSILLLETALQPVVHRREENFLHQLLEGVTIRLCYFTSCSMVPVDDYKEYEAMLISMNIFPLPHIFGVHSV